VLKERKNRKGQLKKYYKARVKKVFKGCRTQEEKIWIETASESAACGVELRAGKKYYLFANKGEGLNGTETYSINSCGPNKIASESVKNERKFLDGRQYSCGDKEFCANGMSPYLKCAIVTCPKCDEDGFYCDTSVCRGCGLSASWIYNASTAELVGSCEE